MKSIARGCHKLQTLVMNDLPNLTDEGLHSLTTQCHSLSHLSLLGATSISDDAFKYLALHSRKLQSIRIEGKSYALGLSCGHLCNSVVSQEMGSLQTWL